MWCDEIRVFFMVQLTTAVDLDVFEGFQKKGGHNNHWSRVKLSQNPSWTEFWFSIFCFRSLHFFAFLAGLCRLAVQSVRQVLKMFMSCLPTLFMAIIHNFLTLKACLVWAMGQKSVTSQRLELWKIPVSRGFPLLSPTSNACVRMSSLRNTVRFCQHQWDPSFRINVPNRPSSLPASGQ